MIYEISIIFAALALGGFVKGVTGAGAPVVAVPIMASFLGVPYAIAIMMVPNVVTNLWQMRQHWGARHGFANLTVLCVLAATGSVVGTWLLTALSASVLNLTLAVVVAAYILLKLVHPEWHIAERPARRAAPWVGLTAGLLQGATGISAPVSITYLSSIRLTRPQFIFAVSTLFVSFTATQLPALAVAGIMTWQRALMSCLAVIPVLAAMPIGASVGARLSQQTFDRVILALLALIAAKLVYESGLFG